MNCNKMTINTKNTDINKNINNNRQNLQRNRRKVCHSRLSV